MNWYSIFYWISVADGVKSIFYGGAILFTVFASVCFAGMLITKLTKAVYEATKQESYEYNTAMATVKSCDTLSKWWNRTVTPFIFLAIILWMGYAFAPSKRDSLIIVTGGAVGNFITSDSSVKAIPSEAMTLLRDKIRQEIKEMNTPVTQKKIEDMTKEELIELLKKK
jgi:hypothetical protein